MSKSHFSPPSIVEIALHLLTWTYIFLSPLLFNVPGDSLEWSRYLHRMIFPLTLCIIFYVNYLWLIPKYLLTHSYKSFALANILLFLILTFAREGFFNLIFPPVIGPRRRHMVLPWWYFHLRTIIMYAFSCLLAVVISLSKQWKHAEKARQEAEIGRKDAQLQNLRNQINPHFLLNTLNNIYALTTFNTSKAQEAIIQLSKLLRYILYENNEPFVNIEKEVDFLRHYIELMRLRLPENIEINFSVNINPEERIKVAPLIFISLVENAFKHGVSSTAKSFISIALKADNSNILFTTVNSNHPKNSNDKAGSGIGISLTLRRLQLAYPDHFTWQHGPNSTCETYTSTIHITTQ